MSCGCFQNTITVCGCAQGGFMRGAKEHLLGCLPSLTLLLCSLGRREEGAKPAAPGPVPCPPGRFVPSSLWCMGSCSSYLEKIYKPLSTERTRQLSSGLLRKIDQPGLGLILAFSFWFPTALFLCLSEAASVTLPSAPEEEQTLPSSPEPAPAPSKPHIWP